MKPLQVWGYLDEYASERADILRAVDQCFGSGQLVLGRSLADFEQEFAKYLNIEHCVGLDNGTNAISLGLQALGISPGDEVITVANTAAPTVVAIEAVGAVPVFVDVRESDFLLDTELLAAAVTERTRAIVPVHLYGQCVNMEQLLAIAEERGLVIVEDCAQA
ncbi:MAG: DegT/DnrJ/EryC1/StrS family aminotransferase, partial [Angustibacter sp.]